MNKKKLIIAVLLFSALIFMGIILPLFMMKRDSGISKEKQTEDSRTEEPSLFVETIPDITFLAFDELTDFMADSKIEELKSQFTAYVLSVGKTDINSIAFLSDQTSYPSAEEIKLVFLLSDESTLPVYCDRDGRFLFGEEKRMVSEDTKSYKKPTDDNLPEFSSSDVEELQEGGYPDTTSAPEANENTKEEK